EPLLVLLATVLGCWLIYRWLILPVHWLRPCFGVWEKVPANTRAQRAAAADHTSNRTQHQPG
ncbi:MAG: hypothetical protein KDI37_18405, partial [Xanthomonadales bacterium]|nr:hypothetical protein [Xanthomonadales bacterium]